MQFLILCSSLLKRITDEYGKSFDFPKQHAVLHVVDDIQQKGTTPNYSTRPGEGFQQEAVQAYALDWLRSSSGPCEHGSGPDLDLRVRFRSAKSLILLDPDPDLLDLEGIGE